MYSVFVYRSGSSKFIPSSLSSSSLLGAEVEVIFLVGLQGGGIELRKYINKRNMIRILCEEKRVLEYWCILLRFGLRCGALIPLPVLLLRLPVVFSPFYESGKLTFTALYLLLFGIFINLLLDLPLPCLCSCPFLELAQLKFSYPFTPLFFICHDLSTKSVFHRIYIYIYDNIIEYNTT